MVTNDRSQLLKKLYYYDQTSPSHLRWNVEVRSGRNKAKVNVSPGDIAGSLGSSGYYSVRVMGKLTLVHRVIWEMKFGEIPENMFIDHKDQNKVNNNLDNLRLVTKSGNNRNQRLRKDSTSGIVGVNLPANRNRNGSISEYWRAVWFDGQRPRSKAFSINSLGYDTAFRLACEYRESIIAEMNKCGAGYSKQHGIKGE